MTYLDYQATTPLAPEALVAMLPWLENQHANPHSSHREGRAAKAVVDVARAQVAALLPPDGRVAFTSGATEALNWAIKGTTGPIVTLATEHAAVLDTAEAERRGGRAVTVLPVRPDGLVDLDLARSSITPGTGLVAAMLVNNEIGVMQPVAELAAIAHDAGALLLCDAVQGYGRVPIPPECDLVAVSAHKVYGPKGVGALWLGEGVGITPLLDGGGQEVAGRSGTLSPALCAGFGAAAVLMAGHSQNDAPHVERLWELALAGLGLTHDAGPVPASTVPQRTAGAGMGAPRNKSGVTGWKLNGSIDQRYHGNLNIRRDGLDVNRLMSDLRDIAFSAGSACASGSGRPSHVLRAVGLGDAEARSSIRLGFGRYTTEADLADAIDRIVAAANAQRIAA